MIDVAIVGAGPAGLQAALTLGRVHRTVTVFDSGRYRNDPADHMHNFIGRDGTPPADLRDAARRDLREYDTVSFVESAVVRISGEPGAFQVETGVDAGADGRADAVTARRVILATGLADALPDIPGLEPLFGDVVVHCPFCHGHEFAGKTVGVLGVAAHTPGLAGVLAPIATRRVALTNGEDPGAAAEVLQGMGVEVVPGRVTGVRRTDDGLAVSIEGRDDLELGGLFVAPASRQAAPFAEQLGLTPEPSGAVEVDPFGQSTVAGVYAVGDMSQRAGMPGPLAAVVAAAATGMTAAAHCAHSLAADDFGLPH